MHRRSSYAAVAAGNSSSPTTSGPPRAGLFSHLANGNAPGSPPQHYSRPYSRSLDADSYHSTLDSMNPSWGRPPPMYTSHHTSSHHKSIIMPDDEITPFFVPSYLEGSRFAEKMKEKHSVRVAALRESRARLSASSDSLSRSSSAANLHKPPGSHRGIAHDIIERAPPAFEESTTSWPTRWSDSDKNPQMELDQDGRVARFAAPTKTHSDEAASVRADYPMPRQCGIYYYEVTILSKGKDGIFGIGFASPKVSLNRIPGWEPESWAYHGDDGQVFVGSSQGKLYGPKYGTTDVIGCGINFRTGEGFFTKNGQFIAIAFRDLKTDKTYYPIIGAKRPNETLKVNFGQDPFIFDIDKMVKAEKAKIHKQIAATGLSDPGTPLNDETKLIHDLVKQYLTHDGYLRSARAFYEEVNEEERALADRDAPVSDLVTPQDDMHAENRQNIRRAILDGNIDKALKKTKAFFPSVLSKENDNDNIYFRLRCRKFIEMIIRMNELKAQLPPSSKRSPAHNGNDDVVMEDEPPESMDTGDDADREAEFQHLQDHMLEYGQELNREFQHDPRKEVKQALQDCFSLMAYESVEDSHLAPLLDKAARLPVAEELNSAILVSLGRSPTSGLEKLTQDTEALVGALAEDGGPGAFINVRRDYLQSNPTDLARPWA